MCNSRLPGLQNIGQTFTYTDYLNKCRTYTVWDAKKQLMNQDNKKTYTEMAEPQTCHVFPLTENTQNTIFENVRHNHI